MLNAELKSMNSNLTYVSFFVQMCEGWGGGHWRWHHRSSGWTYMQTGRGPGRGGEDRLDCCMTSRSKNFKRIGVSATGR